MAKTAILCSYNSQLGETGHKTGVSLLEIAPIVYELERAGNHVDLFSAEGQTIPLDPSSLDFSNPIARDYFERATFLQKLETPKPLSALTSEYRALVVCGGWGCIPEFSRVWSLGEIIAKSDVAVLAAAGYGTSILLQPALKKMFHGFKVTSPAPKEDHDVGFKKFWSFMVSEELHREGYELSFAKPWSRHVMVSDRLITAQNIFSAQALGETVARQLSNLENSV